MPSCISSRNRGAVSSQLHRKLVPQTKLQNPTEELCNSEWHHSSQLVLLPLYCTQLYRLRRVLATNSLTLARSAGRPVILPTPASAACRKLLTIEACWRG